MTNQKPMLHMAIGESTDAPSFDPWQAQQSELTRLRADNESLRAAAEQMLGALEEVALDAAMQVADSFHEAMAGYRPLRHKSLDDDVQRVKEAIAAGKEALGTELLGESV